MYALFVFEFMRMCMYMRMNAHAYYGSMFTCMWKVNFHVSVHAHGVCLFMNAYVYMHVGNRKDETSSCEKCRHQKRGTQ